MKKVDRFVLGSFIGPLILTFFIVLIVLVLQFLWMYVDELAGKGLEFKILGELLFQFTLTFVPMALPLAILLASLMTFGNMGEHLELTALKSSGISLQRIMRPLMVFISLIVIGSFFFSNNVLPYSTRKARTLLHDIRNKRPELNIQPGVFYDGIDGFSIKIRDRDHETNLMHNILIYDHRERRGNYSVTTADSGYMVVTPDRTGLVLTLYNGYSHTEMDESSRRLSDRTFPSRRNTFDEQVITVELTGFELIRSDESLFGSHSGMLNISELSTEIDSLHRGFNDRVSTYFNEFKSNKLYRSDQSASTPEREPGHDRAPPAPFNTEKAFNQVQGDARLAALRHAMDNVKNASNFIDEKGALLHNEVNFIRRYENDWHRKFTLPFSCLVFFFIGAPLGAIIRKGGLGTPAVISILFFVIYYVISLSGEKLGREDHLSSFAGMWLSSFVLLPAGVILTYMATTDSVIMSSETYTNFGKRFYNYLRRVTRLR